MNANRLASEISPFLVKFPQMVNFVDAKNYFIHASINKIAKARFSMPEAASLLKNLDIVIE